MEYRESERVGADDAVAASLIAGWVISNGAEPTLKVQVTTETVVNSRSYRGRTECRVIPARSAAAGGLEFFWVETDSAFVDVFQSARAGRN